MMVQWFLRLSVHTAERFSKQPLATARDVIALEQDLEELLGRRVEVLTDGGLNPYLPERILTEAQAL